MNRKLLFLFCYLILIGPANAGLKEFKDGCVDRFERVTGSISNGVSKLASKVDIKNFFNGARDRASTLIDQVESLACTSASCTASFGLSLGKSFPPAVIRVITFGPSISKIKKELIVPLVATTRMIKENSDNPDIIASSIAKLIVFTAETEAKLIRTFGLQVVSAPLNASFIAANVAITKTTNAQKAASFFGDIVISRMKTIMYNDELSFEDRVKALVEVDDITEYFANEIKFDDLDDQVEKWIQKSYRKKILEQRN